MRNDLAVDRPILEPVWSNNSNGLKSRSLEFAQALLEQTSPTQKQRVAGELLFRQPQGM